MYEEKESPVGFVLGKNLCFFFSCLGDSHPQGPGDLHACTLSLTFSRPMGDLLTESLDHLSAGTLHRSPGYTTQHHAHQSSACSLRLGCSCLDPLMLHLDDSFLFWLFQLAGLQVHTRMVLCSRIPQGIPHSASHFLTAGCHVDVVALLPASASSRFGHVR